MKKSKIPIQARYCLPVFLLIFFTGLISQAQDTIHKKVQEDRDSIVIASGEGNFSLSFIGKDVLETRFSPNENNSDSLIVYMGNGNQDLKLNVSEVADSLSLTSEGIEILIKKEPFGITYNFQQVWLDFRNGKRNLPGSSLKISGEDDLVPLLIKSGAVFPVLEEEKFGEAYRHLQLHYVFSSETRKDQRETCAIESIGTYCYNVEIETGSNLDIVVQREAIPLAARGDEMDVEEVDFVVHPINRSVNFVWVNGIKYTGKNYMHDGRLVVPLNFPEDKAVLKIEWN